MINDATVILAACYRSPFLSLVAATGDRPVEVRWHRLRTAAKIAAAEKLITAFAAELGADVLVVEAGSLINRQDRLPLPMRFLTMCDVKTAFGVDLSTRRADLCQKIVGAYPELRRFVTVFPATGRIATTRLAETATILAAGLALSASRTRQTTTNLIQPKIF